MDPVVLLGKPDDRRFLSPYLCLLNVTLRLANATRSHNALAKKP